MDFHTMKRKKLQKLCKKHHLHANLTNLEMAHNLSSLLKIEEKGELMRRTKPCLKGCLGENEDEYDGLNKKQEKKVRFSPENEVFVVGDYYEKTEFYELRRVKKDKQNLGAKALLDQMVLIQPRHLN